MSIYLRDEVDELTLADVKAGYHLPPPDWPASEVVLDLGAHAGLTALDYLNKFPGCRVIAVEMDAGNVRVAQDNLAGKNAVVVHAAVTTWTGTCSYDGEQSNCYQVTDEPGGSTPCVTLDALLERYGLESVDLMKVDVEGSEKAIFKRGGGWPRKVGGLVVELHGRYFYEEASADLERLGYSVERNPLHKWSLFARRR